MNADERTAPEALAPKKRRVSGWRWVIYAALLCAAALMAAPNFLKARTTECKNACVNNLRQIDGAKEQWALEMKLPDGTPADTNAISRYIKGGWPACPAGGILTPGAIGAAPVCTIAGHSI